MSDERRELIQALAVASYMEATPINDWISTAIRDADALLAALDAERKERDALLAEVQSLQRALAFWMPRVPAGESPAIDRLANDAWLLSGYEGEDEPDAESMGWVVLNALAKEPTT